MTIKPEYEEEKRRKETKILNFVQLMGVLKIKRGVNKFNKVGDFMRNNMEMKKEFLF